ECEWTGWYGGVQPYLASLSGECGSVGSDLNIGSGALLNCTLKLCTAPEYSIPAAKSGVRFFTAPGPPCQRRAGPRERGHAGCTFEFLGRKKEDCGPCGG